MSTTANPPRSLKELRAQYDADRKALKAVVDKGDDATADDLLDLERLTGALDATKAEIDRFAAADSARKALDLHHVHATQPVNRLGPTDTKASDVHIETVESEEDKFVRMGPWKGIGHFAYEVRKYGGNEPGRCLDERTTLGRWNRGISDIDRAVKGLDPAVKAIDGMSELVDSDGAAFVPTDISGRVWERVTQDQTNLMNLCDVTPVSGNSLRLPAYNDKDRSNGLYGASGYWQAEGGQYTGTKFSTRNIDLRLNKFGVFMYTTEELYEDVPALDARLNRVAAENITYFLNKAIVRGTGVGQPLGLLAPNLKARYTQAAVSGQGAGTIIGQNITNMFMHRPYQANASVVWLYNRAIEPQLDQLSFTSGTNQVVTFMYLQAGGLRGRENPELKSRPMIEMEHCSNLGTEGDLILWDPKSYGIIVKTSGVKQQVSMHFKFDTGEMTFKWYLRVDGRPLWDDVMTMPNSAPTLAPIVTLNSTRA